ncbi:ferredoxin [Nocardia miyunensis]|uniref:ferredoxin n=1 Tax=Nocardia miyunensis TaxID=282684 RepID=UPI00082E8AF9|nr:ferredoxin [Nocardia miyunensis]
MEIHIDRHRCEGHALCASIAPTVFEVGDDDLATVVDSSPAEDIEPKVHMAVDACPTLAISLGGPAS